MTTSSQPRRLRLTVLPPRVRQGNSIQASIDAVNVAETIVKLEAPDIVVISQPHVVSVGSGTFEQTISWTVQHVQTGTRGTVEITVSDGHLTQKGLCQIDG